jgi:hypothetical protein
MQVVPCASTLFCDRVVGRRLELQVAAELGVDFGACHGGFSDSK